jgi:hypothetical protein
MSTVPHRWEAVADEDQSTGFLLDSRPDESVDHGALVGVFIALYDREFDTLFDPRKLTISARPKPFRSDDSREEYVPTTRPNVEVWAWVIHGLDEEGAIVR